MRVSVLASFLCFLKFNMNTTLRRATNWFSLLGLLLFLSVNVNAQQYELAPSPALACLTLTPGAPSTIEYPEALYKSKSSGKVIVDLEFFDPEAAPKVEVFDQYVESQFILVVKKHVAQFRLPCIKNGDAPVHFRQEYNFLPHDSRRVVSSTPIDLAHQKKIKQLQCIAHIKPGTRPRFPVSALRRGSQGNFFVALRFNSPDQPPVVTWLAAASDSHLKESVADFVEGLRMPCLDDTPFVSTFIYSFNIEGGSRVFLKDSDLLGFLSSAREMQKPVEFDFDTMNCPFDLRVNYRRPYAPSGIGELENSNIARKPFLAWLSKVTLDLNESDNNRVLGSIFTLHVPCGSLKL